MAARTPQVTPSPQLLQQTVLSALVDVPAHGPFPARFRASGARDIWALWLQQCLPIEQFLWLRQTEISPTRCAESIVKVIEERLAPAIPNLQPTEYKAFAEEGGHLVATALAYWERKGSLIECTPALLGLLEHTDLTHELPAQLLRLPFPVLYFQGLPLRAGEALDVEGVFLFEHEDEVDHVRALTIIPVLWVGKQVMPLQAVTLSIIDESVPLVDWIAKHVDGSWPDLLAAVAKVLLYMGLKDARRMEQNAYTDAPRNFSGLGKRKRHLRIAEIERLYDRILIGPETLPGARPAVADGHTVAPHWRRGHFRQQPYGAGGRERRPIFIAPVIVNASALDADAPSPKTYKPTR